MPDPTALRAAAADLRVRAALTRALLDDVARLATARLWTGPVARRFEAELGEQRAQLRSAADELLTTAAAMDRRADAIDEARRRLAAAEAARTARANAARDRLVAPARATAGTSHHLLER